MEDLLDIYELANLFWHGGRIARDAETALKLFGKAVESGDSRARYPLALLCLDTSAQGEDSSNKRSLGLMTEAAADGDNRAVWWLARNRYSGKIIGQDMEQAVHWLSVLTARNDCPPKAWLLLGDCQYYGKGLEKDREAAFQSFQRALVSTRPDKKGTTENLSRTDIRKIHYLIGTSYYFGEGISCDYGRALKHLLLSVQDGEYLYPNPEAEYLIGTCYYYHRGTKQDIPTALFWLEDAAAQGNEKAMSILNKRKH